MATLKKEEILVEESFEEKITRAAKTLLDAGWNFSDVIAVLASPSARQSVEFLPPAPLSKEFANCLEEVLSSR